MSVVVPVVQVRVVWMPVLNALVPVTMAVGLGDRQVARVIVPVMLVVAMRMFVRDPLVAVPVSVPLGEMEPDADGHERGGDDETRGQRFT